MLGIGLPELILILILALVIIGPKDLPKMARTIGITVRNIKRGLDEFKENLEDEVLNTESLKKESLESKSSPEKDG
jgi:Tat protein translocase TatB subunit